MTEPALNYYAVEREGEMSITVLGETTLWLDTDRERDSFDDDFSTLREAPVSLCNQFEASPFSVYTGLIEQTQPVRKSLARRVILSYAFDKIQAQVSYTGPRPEDRTADEEADFYSFPGARLRCELMAETLMCRNENNTQVLSGKLTASSFAGTFQGLGDKALPQTAGSFNVSKRLE